MKTPDLVVISTFPSTTDAQIAKGVLDDAGIDSMIRADDAGGMYPTIRGAQLLVRSEDVAAAREALNQQDPSTQT
jgi:Putative prokaryotic signal transducing protein